MMQPSLLCRRPIGLLVIACSLITLTGCPAPSPAPKGAIDPVTATREANPTAPVVSESPNPAVANAAPSNAEGSYSIADRRIMEYYNTKFMPEAEARITKTCQDAKVKITIDWSSFGKGAEASKNLEALTNSNAINQSVDSTVSALESVCTDKIGREAVASKFTGIQVMHQNASPETSFKFANGVATIAVNVNESNSPWIQDIQKALESGL